MFRGWIASVAWLIPSVANAAGYYISDVGTRSMARGGAYVAAPDSLLALHYNPAGLSLLEGAHLEADVSLVSFGFDFTRSCPCADPSLANAAEIDAGLTAGFGGRTATNDASAAVVPFLAAGIGFPELKGLSFAIGIWGPTSPKTLEFGPNTGPAAAIQPQRYTATALDLYEAWATFGAAVAPIDGFRVGLSLSLYDFGTTQSAHLWANSTLATDAEDAEWDVPVELDFRRNAAVNWGLGISYDVIPSLSVGASVLGKRSVRAEGTAKITLPETIADVASITGDKVEIEVNLPPITRFGVQLSLPELLELEASVVIEAWSVHERVKVHSKDVQVTLLGQTNPLTPVTIERGLSDTYSLRLGGEFTMFEPWFGLRAGYFFEPSAVPDERLTADLPDLDKHGLSLGASTSFMGIRLDVAGQYILLTETEVTDSKAKQSALLAPPLGSNTYLTTQGNGVYSGSYFIFSTSLSVAFDPLLG